MSDNESTTPASSLATHRLPRDGFPAFNRYYEDTKTAFCPSLAPSHSARRPIPRLLSLSWRPQAKSAPAVRDLVHAGVIRSGHLSEKQKALPASLETPSPLCPALRPRADLHALPTRRFGVAPARSNTKAPPFTFLRDSMTRLHGSLPTLGGTITGYLHKARFRWVVSPFRAGLIPPGLDRNFQLLATSTASFRFWFLLTSAIPVSQGFGWRHER